MTAPRPRSAAVDRVRRRGRPVAFLSLVLAAGCGGGAPPRLVVGQPVVDAAADASGRRSVRIELRNDGGGDLLLHGARLDCGCRLLAPLPDVLAPGERVPLAVRCRAAVAGARTRTLAVLSNDPERPEALSEITVPAGDMPQREPVYFGYVALGRSVARDVALRADEGDATAAAGADPALAVEERPPHPDGTRALRLRFTPRATGPFHGTLMLGRTALRVSGVGYRDVIALPAEVGVGETTAGAPPTIAIKAVGGAPITITGVETPEGLSGDVQTISPGRDFRLVLRTRNAKRAPGGTIVLRTNDPDEPVVTIPLRDGDV